MATDPREFTREQHFSRKVRTLTGLIQLCTWTPEILLPWRNPIWIDFVAHKLTRVLLPAIAAVAAVASVWLTVRLAGDALVWASAAVVLLIGTAATVRPGLAREAAWVAKLSTAPLLALLNAVRGRWEVWQPSTDTTASVARSAP